MTKKLTYKELEKHIDVVAWRGAGLFLIAVVISVIIILFLITNDISFQEKFSECQEQVSLRYYCYTDGIYLSIESFDGYSSRRILLNVLDLPDYSNIFYNPKEVLSEYGLKPEDCEVIK